MAAQFLTPSHPAIFPVFLNEDGFSFDEESIQIAENFPTPSSSDQKAAKNQSLFMKHQQLTVKEFEDAAELARVTGAATREDGLALKQLRETRGNLVLKASQYNAFKTY